MFFCSGAEAIKTLLLARLDLPIQLQTEGKIGVAHTRYSQGPGYSSPSAA
jgi:hypothetical protein